VSGWQARTTWRRTLAVVAGAVMLIGAACGGDDDDSSGDSAASGEAPDTTAAPPDDGGTAAPSDTSGDTESTELSTEGSTEGSTEEPAGQPAQGGRLRYATVSEPTTFDPHRGASGGDHVSLYPIFDRLLNSDPVTLEPQPFLATSFEFTDPLTLEMTLQEGVTFHDGTPFNAEAVVYNIERAKNLEDSSIKSDVQSIESVEAVGEYEVVMHLSQPDSSLLGVFADRAGMMVSPTAAENEDFGQHPVGTGPHTFESWAPGDRWTYERNEDYWQDGLPYLDNLEFTVQTDINTRINGLRSGQYDFIDGIEPGRMAELEEAGGIVVSSDPTLLQHMVWLNTGRGPLADVRVRRAINMALDRQALWEGTMEGTGEVAWMPVPSQHWAYAEDLVPTFEYDPDAARALLEEAGYGDGFTITMTSTATQDAVRRAEIMQAQLAEIGITVEITPEQTVDSVQRYFEAQQVDSYNSSMTSRPDPSITYQTMFSAESFYNTAKASPEGFEDLLREAREAQTPEERQAAFKALDEAAVENALWIPLVYPSSITAHTDEFAGFVPSLIGKPDFLPMYQVQ
jgi:ABC-type transport system substrate-binding protein